MHPEEFRDTVVSLCAFEARSLVGRLFFNRKPPLTAGGPNLLNLGCGARTVRGWINAEFFARNPLRSGCDWQLDMRYPLKCNDSVFDGVFSEHALEHLYPQQAMAVLRELHRTMKPGAVLRLCLPDLAKVVDFYRGGENAILEAKHPVRATAVWGLTQNWGHRSVWDAELLARYLQDAGFRDIGEQDYQGGADQRLLIESEQRRDVSFYMEGRK